MVPRNRCESTREGKAEKLVRKRCEARTVSRRGSRAYRVTPDLSYDRMTDQSYGYNGGGDIK